MSYPIGTTLLKTLETSSSIGMFARDTGGCLISRLALSRSNDESREISIAEISESTLFYFSSPFIAKSASSLFSKALKIKKELINEPIENLKEKNKNLEKKVKLSKFARILSTFGIILPLVFSIAPIRNMVTLAKSGKEEFTNVIDLDKKEHKGKTDSAKEKTKELCKKLGSITLGLLGLTLGTLLAAKNNKIYKKLEPIINRTIKHFDFTKNSDLTLKHYGALIYPVSIASYFYASRDKYEVRENARRFSITVPLLFYGEKLIQNPIHKMADKYFKTNVYNNGEIKSYDDIMKMGKKDKIKSLKTKNLAYATTFFINTMAIAAGVALLNRYETQNIYKKDKKNAPAEGNNIWNDMKI